MVVYRCEYRWKGCYIFNAISKEGIQDFKDGFWINSDCKFTKSDDRKFWIPPTNILYIAIDQLPEDKKKNHME